MLVELSFGVEGTWYIFAEGMALFRGYRFRLRFLTHGTKRRQFS